MRSTTAFPFCAALGEGENGTRAPENGE